jgi:iron transport multicopper oxidase
MFRLFLFVIIVLSEINAVTSVVRRREYTLTVSYAANSSSIVLINNQFPGPLIEAELNDILIIHVRNNLASSEDLTIHFHGMFQRETPNMDGSAFITQMPIPSGESFTHVFRAYPAGTHFYHSHSGLQAVTAFGPLLVHDSQKPWNLLEIPNGPLLFSDQWLTSDRLVQEAGLLASPFRWEGEPTDLLINGKRNFVMTLRSNTKYLLRLIGATSLSTVVFGIDQHPMTVVEVDGTLIKPKSNVNSIEIGTGQRYAVTIQTKKQSQGVFLMELAIRWRTLPGNSR